MVKYYYDAWGNSRILDANGNPIYDTYHLGNLNPFKYRSYYRDIETGLYYLENRYYDPNTGRFISPDDISYLDPDIPNGLNLYAYCNNNPVMYSDTKGYKWYHWAIGGAVIAVCATLTVVTAGGFAAAGTAFASVVSATMAPTALSAVFAGATIGATAIGVGGMVLSGQSGENEEWSWENASRGFMFGSVSGAVIGSAWGGTHYALQNTGHMSIKTNINNLVNNPTDEFVTIGPKNGQISNCIQSISQTGNYGTIYASRLQNGMYQIENAHHRVAALKALGYKTVKFLLV